jgi:hypothetical protein
MDLESKLSQTAILHLWSVDLKARVTPLLAPTVGEVGSLISQLILGKNTWVCNQCRTQPLHSDASKT